MAETDILNPQKGYDPQFKDSMNPNLGWNRDRPTTLAMVKPAFGAPFTRQIANTGHVYKLSYTRRNLIVTERLKQFFEQFEQGFFTLIDWDNGRHYVGRFEGAQPQVMEANGRFSSQGWNFVEMPGAPMLEYPSDFDRWGIVLRPIDDWGDAAAASGSTVANAWTQPPNVVGDDGVSRPVRQLQNTVSPTGGDWITHEYRGFGFRLWAGVGPSYGAADLYVDGVKVATLDCSAAAEMGPQIVYTNTAMPLDIHRVQIVLPGGTTTIPATPPTPGSANISSLLGAFADAAGNVLGTAIGIGDGGTFTPPAGATQLLLGVNDDAYHDNTGSWVISAGGTNYTVLGTTMPWSQAGGLNAAYPFGNLDGTAPVSVPVTAGVDITLTYVSGTISIGPTFSAVPPTGVPSTPVSGKGGAGTYFPSHYLPEIPGTPATTTDTASSPFLWDKLEVIR